MYPRGVLASGFAVKLCHVSPCETFHGSQRPATPVTSICPLQPGLTPQWSMPGDYELEDVSRSSRPIDQDTCVTQGSSGDPLKADTPISESPQEYLSGSVLQVPSRVARNCVGGARASFGRWLCA